MISGMMHNKQEQHKVTISRFRYRYRHMYYFIKCYFSFEMFVLRLSYDLKSRKRTSCIIPIQFPNHGRTKSNNAVISLINTFIGAQTSFKSIIYVCFKHLKCIYRLLLYCASHFTFPRGRCNQNALSLYGVQTKVRKGFANVSQFFLINETETLHPILNVRKNKAD